MEDNTEDKEKNLILTIFSKDISHPLRYNLSSGEEPLMAIQEFLKGRYVFSQETQEGWYINPASITFISIAEYKEPEQIEATPEEVKE